MKDIIIERILSDVCSHKNVTDGIVNFNNQSHIDVLKEVLSNLGIGSSKIEEIACSLGEGNFPERQAYNKEGFLVTFPDPVYKKKALSTGKYSEKDPTGGSGGMHLIKKVDTVDVNEPKIDKSKSVNTSTSDASKPQAKSVSEPTPPTPSTPTETSPVKKDTTTTKAPTDAPHKVATPHIASTPTQQPTSVPKPPQTDITQYTTGVPVSPSTNLDLGKISAYKDPSLEWAHNRKWIKRENNNYYDDAGNLKAITGLDDSVIPVSEEERLSLKQFIEDKTKEKLGIKPKDEESDV